MMLCTQMESGQPASVRDEESSSSNSDPPNNNVWFPNTPPTSTNPPPPFSHSFPPAFSHNPSLTPINHGFTPTPILDASLSATTSSTDGLQPVMSSISQSPGLLYGATPTPNTFTYCDPFNQQYMPATNMNTPFLPVQPSQSHPPLLTGGHNIMLPPLIPSFHTPPQPATTISHWGDPIIYNSGMDHQQPWQQATPLPQQDM